MTFHLFHFLSHRRPVGENFLTQLRNLAICAQTRHLSAKSVLLHLFWFLSDEVDHLFFSSQVQFDLRLFSCCVVCRQAALFSI